MCGIAGFYGFQNDSLIKQMSRDLAHRGPDGEGFYCDETTSLLSRRLAIIDIAGGDQPIYNEDKSLLVVYNGEIYNYQQLRKELEEAGHSFSTRSDTEVIVHGYEQWGSDCFDKFNGMFGIALYDTKARQLILARDHFGIKPLYYSFTHGATLIFASEIKPLLHSKLLEKKPNDRLLYRYLNFRIHDDQEETFFEGIYKLMPGQMMIITPEKMEKRYFSRLKEELLALPVSEYQEKDRKLFGAKLIEAITLRLISEVPVGTCLSGGLDSSTVVAVVNKLLEEKTAEALSVGSIQNTFSAVFPGSTNDEERYIDDVIARHYSIKSHKIRPKPEEFFQDLEDFIRTQEEPTISTGPYAQYKVMQEATKYVTVLLDGQGADEMMAGYLPYYFVYLRQLLAQKKYLTLASEVFGSLDILGKYFSLKLSAQVGVKRDVHVRSLLANSFRERFTQETFPVVNNNLKKRLVEDIFYNSLPSLLRYEDKNSMRFSIEGRVPFLDITLLRYLFSLSDKAIITKGWNKYILRKAIRSFLPASIITRRNKIGFTTPEHEWFMRMKNKIYGIFLSESFSRRPYFNQQAVLKAFQQFVEGKTEDTMLFWRILNIELWLRLFFDEQSATKAIVPQETSLFVPNPGKTLEIHYDETIYLRFPVKTALFQKGDDIAKKVSDHVLTFSGAIAHNGRMDLGVRDALQQKPWFIAISEKVVAISQGRSYFIWDIKPGIWAKLLAKFVTKTPFGIGLGSPWTMQIAIDEVGLTRILFAATAAALTKPLGIKGLFYRLVGREVASIDGPTEYSLYPSNVSAKLGPKNPEHVAKQIHAYMEKELPGPSARHFQGVIIIDANDLGRDVLGNSTPLKAKAIEQILKDNPMGQSNEQTPLVVVFPR